MDKIIGIKKAVGDFNNWQGTARIYFDTADGKVWTMVYSDPNSYDIYRENTIHEIHNKATVNMAGRDDTITMKRLKELCINQ